MFTAKPMWRRLKVATTGFSLVGLSSQASNPLWLTSLLNGNPQPPSIPEKDRDSLRKPTGNPAAEASSGRNTPKSTSSSSSPSPELINLIGIPESERGYVGTLIGIVHALSIAASVTRLGFVAYHKKPASSNFLPFVVIGACTYLYFGYFQEALVGMELNTSDKTLNVTKGLTAQKKHKIKLQNLRLVEGDLSWSKEQDLPRDSIVVEFRTSDSAHWQTGHLLSEQLLSLVLSQKSYDRALLAAVLQGDLKTVEGCCLPR